MPCCFFYLEKDQAPSFPSNDYCPFVLPLGERMKARRVKGKGVWRKKALSTEGCQQIRRGREEQLMQLIVWQCCQGTGPGEGPGKNIWAVARTAGLGNSHKFLKLVREGDRLPWQGWHSPVSNFFSLLLEFLKQYITITHTLEVTVLISVQMLTVWTQMCHTEHWKVKLWPERGGINMLCIK